LDELFLIGDEKLTDGCKRELTSEFEMKDLDFMRCGRGQMRFFLSQGKYTVEILQVHGHTYGYESEVLE
jgi:hypothetical protein